MGDISPERKAGCGLMTTVFGRRSKKTSSVGSAPIPNNVNDPKRRRGGSKEVVSVDAPSQNVPNTSTTRSVSKTSSCSSNNNPQKTTMPRGPSKVLNSSTTEGYVNQGRRVPKEAVGISGELESMINDHQKSKGSSTLIRASSGNVMLYGNLGNLRQGDKNNSYSNAMDNYNQYFENANSNARGGHTNNVTSVRKETKSSTKLKEEKSGGGSLCRAISTRMDPEQLKIMGNEDYKNGRFAEALSLYDAAIAIDPKTASYRSNRSAALTALGRLLEAVFECREAIQIDPHYHRAHHRLGNLHFRLGETDKALYHYKQAGPEADPDEVAKVKILQAHLSKCTEARRLGDWNTLITETSKILSSGADSAPQIFALQAEALIKLRRHQDADNVMSKCPNFDVDDCTKFFGPIGNSNLLVTRAQVDIAAGRFDDALEAAQKAARLDPNNKVANKVLRKARAVTAARGRGNELFKASKFSEACVAYGEGLEHDPYNSILLCNRAACRSKLSQLEKAVEDCTAALNLRPSYTKARLRRADCNDKMERWEASIGDYEILLRETPEDEELNRALLEARAQLKKQRGG
ncbi:putative tetratricopeptide-like helical domain-containing protein [Medicago truncatula]|uniref:Inactive TPR repeat thioredoxin TTL3-like protein n=1 Tax=Medicago truncatula TaxID=3880 RepID=G7J3U4_MEDTR|nr:TPR repeat-containing thioredoxin TTL1 [Medicago truncatula]AES72229.1 inactive TPR repeat thioredoxin TTL3-like protein [Medicago truncatula]RHN69393.1 putative tetratricopeptide-like helical domain-containing protein [Medicago truncatula]